MFVSKKTVVPYTERQFFVLKEKGIFIEYCHY